MKPIFSKLGRLVALLWLSLLACPASAYDFEVDGIYYNITSMSNLEVEVTNNSNNYQSGSTYNNTTYKGDVVIPPYVNYNNKTFYVTAIGECAFGGTQLGYGCDVTSVSLPNSLQIKKKHAFRGCTKLNTILMTDGIIEIGDFAIYETPLLQSIELPNSIEKIGRYSLSYTGLTELIIPNSVKVLGERVCADNNNLRRIIIGNSVSEVGLNAFAKNYKLIEVFCTGIEKPTKLSKESFEDAHSALEIYVPSFANYEFGKEYLSFVNNSFQYSGKGQLIEWSNNLKGYKCEIPESDCVTQSNTGSYTQNLKATYSDGVNVTVEIPFTYTIKPAPMSLTVQDAQREYGEPNPGFTCSISGFVNGESEQTLGSTPTYECSATQLSNVGNYRIFASLEAPNYEITYKYGMLTVLPAQITVGVKNSTKIYGEPNPAFELNFTGLKNGDTTPNWETTPTVTTEADLKSGVGDYEINVSGGNATNYQIYSYSPGILTITKKSLTAKANNCERLYGEENPTFTISYVGFVNGDSQSDFISEPVAECSATSKSNAGSYPITVSEGSAANYSFIYQDGVLTVRPLEVGFKDVYNSVTYNDMKISSNDLYFNFIPEIFGPFNEDDFWIELWFLDKDNRYSDHVATIAGGDYAGSYVNTNSNREMYAGKYIFNLTSKGTNPNVKANPSRAYVTVNRASTNLEWNSDSPILVGIGDKVDLGISYQADLWCSFNTEFDEELLTLTSENKQSRNPHWYATGLKEGETTLYFSIECRKNDMGFYDFVNSNTISKRIKVVEGTGALESVNGDTETGPYYVFNLQGVLIMKTEDKDRVQELPAGLYIVNGKKIIIR